MLSDQEQLSHLVITSSKWKWLPRMVDTEGRTFIEYADAGEAAWLHCADDGCEWLSVADKLPDLSDPGTKGGLLLLIREAWNNPDLTTQRVPGGWQMYGRWPNGFLYVWPSEESCLVHALLEAK